MPRTYPRANLLLATQAENFSLGDSVSFELIASETDGRLLVFKNAILARAETNRNLDEIPAEEIDNLAGSIAGRPIDLEHRLDINVGVFTGGRAVDTPLGRALSVDGAIWADRYPAEAAGVQAGTHQLSVEAAPQAVSCSQCGNSFTASQDYCEHLKNRRKFRATRRATGLTAVGGALTQRPAGTATAFDRTQLFLVASHDETVQAEETPTMHKCPRCREESENEATCSKCGKSMAASAIFQELEAALDEKSTLATQLSAAEAERATLTASLETAQGEKTAAEQAAAEAKEKAVEAQAKLRRQLLAGHMDDETWTSKQAIVMAMAEDQFDLFLGAYAAKPAETPAAGVQIPARANAKSALTF